MKKIVDLNINYFYGIYSFFEKSRNSFYKSPLGIFIVGIVNLALVIPYNQMYGSNDGKNFFGLQIFFFLMLFLLGLQWVLSICLFINIKLKKVSKRLFSIYYLVIVMTIMLTLCLVSLVDTAYVDYDDYLIILSILAFIFCIIFFVICVGKERKKIIEGYYLKENKNEIINVKRFMFYLYISLIL